MAHRNHRLSSVILIGRASSLGSVEIWQRNLLLGARYWAVAFLVGQALGAALWWLCLFLWPDTRVYFRAVDAPDSALLSFIGPDLFLFIGTSLLGGIALFRQKSWAGPILCVHAGAAGYAGLYCWSLVWWTGGEAVLGGIFMLPSLVIPGCIAARFSARSMPL